MMTPQEWLQAELRLLYECGEQTTFEKDAERILVGLVAFSSTPPPPVTLTEAIEAAGGVTHRVKISKLDDEERPTCVIVMMDGAECGYDIRHGGARCEYGHRQ